MTDFEDQLKQVLQRQEPSGDFTARVMARCAREHQKKRFWSTSILRVGAAAAALTLVTGGVVYQRHEQEVRGQEAKRKLLLAMRIAGEKLQDVQRRVVENEETGQ